MAVFRFRLQFVVDQKIRTKEAAEKSMAECQRELQEEQTTLARLRRKADDLAGKIATARRQMVQPPPPLIHNLGQCVEHLRGLTHDAEDLRETALAQELVVEDAEAKLHQAREHLAACSRDAEILNRFKEKQQCRFIQDEKRREEIEQDEAGNLLHLIRKRTQ